MAPARESWGTRLGFILAAVGGAVGFGNVVRFPAFVAESGGAAFVLVYLSIVLLLGVPALLAEMVIGREGGGDPITSFTKLGGKAWQPIGALFVVSAVFFLGFYVVLNGYVLLYIVKALTFQTLTDPVSFYVSAQAGPMTLLATALVCAAAVGVISMGVRAGLERAGLILMPILGVILAGLAVYGMFQPGAGAGIAFYMKPDFGSITGRTLVAALGQAFFSLGIGLGFLITYGSYLTKKSNLPADGITISLGDTGVAVLAGFMVFPLLFAFGLQGSVTGADINAFAVLFVTLPQTFAQIGGAIGPILQLAFFIALFFAAFTSTIAILAVPMAALMDRFGLDRRRSALIAGLAVYGLAIWPALSPQALGEMDAIASTFILPAAGLAAAVFVGYRMKGAGQALDRGSTMRIGRAMAVWWRTGLPVIIAALLVLGLIGRFT